MIQTLYLKEEARALLVAGLEDIQTSHICVCVHIYAVKIDVKNVQTHLVVSCICVFVANIHDNDPEWLNPFIPLDLQLPDESIISQPSRASCKNQQNLIKNSSQMQSNVSLIIAAHGQVHSSIARIYCSLEIQQGGPLCLRCSARIWERYDLRGVGRRLSVMADMVRAMLLICGYI